MSSLPKLGIFISGTGSNLKAILEACNQSVIHAKPVVVISSNPEAKGLNIAKLAHIDSFTLKNEPDILKTLQEYGVDLIILAGYMKLIGPLLLRHYPQKILNIHPSLLPSFKGLDAQQQALDYGVKITGCTVHIVDEKIDNGPILMQTAVPIKHDDTLDQLTQRILEQEHQLYPKAIQHYLDQLGMIS